MISNYIDNVVFEIEANYPGSLFNNTFEIYHETLDTIRHYLDTLRLKNGLEIISVKYYNLQNLIRHKFKYE